MIPNYSIERAGQGFFGPDQINKFRQLPAAEKSGSRNNFPAPAPRRLKFNEPDLVQVYS